MNCQKTALYLIAFTIILSMFQTSSAQDSFTIEINTPERQINYGDPLFVSLNLRFTQPRVSRKTGKPLSFTKYSGWVLRVQHADENQASLFPLRLPLRFTLIDANGLEYTTMVKVFCDLYEEKGKLIKKMILDKPGTYTLSIIGAKRQSSNTLDILVQPSSLNEKALSLLADPKDFTFLLGGVYKSPQTVSHLKEVVNQCEGTVLAKWAAARLGLEYFEEFHKKHPSFKDFKEQWEQGGIKEPLFSRALEYLSAGAELPDEFPIREKILYQLTRTEAIRGNYEKAFSLLDELGAKYPKGKYGKRSSSAKAELIELQKRELAQAPQPQVSG
ncbi:hypothetical protein KA005_48875, partial [bacterium]|nr:hypothetical protein [bacterium]